MQLWIERLALAGDVAAIIRTYAPLAWASIAASLVSVEGICAENPDPPSPITAADVLAQTASTATGSAIGSSAVIDKAYAWLKYQQFLEFCQCNAPPTTPGNNCTNAPASISLPSLGAIAGPYPITIDQAVLDSWVTFPNGDWQWGFDGSSSISGAASTGHDLLVQFQAANGAWVDGPDLERLNASPLACELVTYQASVPKIGAQTAVRIRNDAGGAYTISGFVFCFCAPAGTPPALPVQPPLTGTPTPPLLACGTDDLCAMITELAHRLTLVASQVSDIQASLTGADVLTQLDQLNISGEGQVTLALGTRAVSVELTDLGDEAFTSALGNPRGLMRVGSIRWFDGTGYSPRRFIDADQFDDPRPAGALAISWQLLEGTSGILKFLG